MDQYPLFDKLIHLQFISRSSCWRVAQWEALLHRIFKAGAWIRLGVRRVYMFCVAQVSSQNIATHKNVQYIDKYLDI